MAGIGSAGRSPVVDPGPVVGRIALRFVILARRSSRRAVSALRSSWNSAAVGDGSSPGITTFPGSSTSDSIFVTTLSSSASCLATCALWSSAIVWNMGPTWSMTLRRIAIGSPWPPKFPPGMGTGDSSSRSAARFSPSPSTNSPASKPSIPIVRRARSKSATPLPVESTSWCAILL